MMKRYSQLFLYLVLGIQLSATCDCPNCPLLVPELSTVTSTINITGATSTTLGAGGQSICQVCVNFTSDAIPELDLILTSPSGSTVTLIQNTGISFNIRWELIALNNQMNLPMLDDNQLALFEADGGLYQVQFTLRGNLFESCDSIFTINLSIDETVSAGDAITLDPLCNDIIKIDLFDYIENNDPNGQWFVDGVSTNNISDPADLTGTIYYEVPANGLCPADSTQINVEISEFPDIEIESLDISCFGFSDGEITVTNNSGEAFTATLVDGGDLFSLSEGFYDIIYTNSLGCDTIISGIEITEPDVLEVSLGPDIVLTQEDSVLIQAILSIAENDVSQVSWEDLQGVIDTQSFSLTIDVDNANTINIEILDANGCIANDELNVAIASIFPDIYT